MNLFDGTGCAPRIARPKALGTLLCENDTIRFVIAIPTTLILGAGASVPYGYPVSRDLTSDVLRIPFPKLSKHDFAESELANFKHHLQRASMDSIDSFVERYPRYERLAKACIAYAIANRESETAIFPPLVSTAPRWYEILARAIEDGKHDVATNKLRILTFNYDRSLEFFLTDTIAARLEISREEAIERLSCIPIVHIYGSVGACPPQMTGARPYESTSESLDRAIEEAQESIRLIPDQRAITKTFEIAHDAIMAAERVLFLGFGFNETNVRRLRAFDTKWPDSAGRTVWSSSVGMSAARCQHAAQLLNGNWTLNLDGALTIEQLITEDAPLDASP